MVIHTRRFLRLIILSILFLSWGTISLADSYVKAEDKDTARAMNNQRLDKLIKRIDPKAEGENGYWQFIVDNRQILVITDEKADRMRIISPIVKTDELTKKRLYRIMQANFDSALDARYSIAKQTLWSTFIHPLASLSDREFLSALGQVANLVNSYGGSYSSGALIFQGGDSKDLQPRRLIDELLEKGLTV